MPESAPKPYFENEHAAIYLANALDVLPALPKVDLLLTDPPYSMAFRSNMRTERLPAIANDLPSDRESVLAVLEAAVRAVRPCRHAYLFGPLTADEAERLRLAKTVQLFWDKGTHGMGDLSSPWAPAHEPITFGVYLPSKAEREKGKGNLSARLRKGSVLRAPRTVAGARRVIHPSEKPVSILREMIESSSMLGETVLDPFAGSGSTLVAAVMEGRRAIGIEIEEHYCEIAARRLMAVNPAREDPLPAMARQVG